MDSVDLNFQLEHFKINVSAYNGLTIAVWLN